MTIIAMTREMGTLGKDIAAGVADQLGLEVIHHELVESDVSKRLDIGSSEVHHFLEGHPNLMERWNIDRSRLSRYTAEEILKLAAQGNVLIRGWGAANLLRSITHVVCVRICAPMLYRVRIMKERLKIKNDLIALKEIEQNDSAHTRTIRNFFESDWKNPNNYDIVLNTERLPVDVCIDQVCQLSKSPNFRESDATKTILSDKLIEFRVRDVLIPFNSDRFDGQNVYSTKVSSGTVHLSGTTSSDEASRHVIELVSGVPGVTTVDADLATVYPYFSYTID